MIVSLPLDIHSIKGFLAEDEGEALYEYALNAAAVGPCLEIGSYCGKSTVYLGLACQQSGNTLYALDHHRGSEEHQLGEEYHDPDTYDAGVEQIDTFPIFRQTIEQAGLLDTVVPLVAGSALVARHWGTPLGMLFIDGGHSLAAALADYHGWSNKVAPGGILAIHDLFPNPDEGGQAPIHIWRLAQESGQFECLPTVNTLGLLRRLT
ncbi:MAG: class I SAM-dependent methyltransferase [Gammaproteobacteria bacterium]|nr:class I SAM-dependent methyltransferase [Gammaproteobacteria bacterium]NND38868.1 class I SAM-dependent methyltransferase [Pseudomonadales bacterium]MBT8152292.1 class I SAM-dependent methyltransferase [Gammaproteobacteria bacterium]NNL11944.1 class I SAM-dependent methyltransferase [Pseudomonadales bacterium]NNM12521.1 class I SAM-dependent methyltransferase [Pseudomonadales bacterium]